MWNFSILGFWESEKTGFGELDLGKMGSWESGMWGKLDLGKVGFEASSVFEKWDFVVRSK